MLVLVLVLGQLTWDVLCWRDGDGTELPLLPLPCLRLEDSSLAEEPRAVLLPGQDMAPSCLYVCVATHVYMGQNIHVGVYVCMYIATYILSVCAWGCVCVNYLNLRLV